MLWYANKDQIDLNNMRRETRLIVLAEDTETVMNTLLIRPSEDQPNWQAEPDWLNMDRLYNLTVVGELTDATVPVRVPNGHWGFRFLQYSNANVGEARIKQQLNYFNDTVLNQLIKVNTGSLLWITDYSAYTHGTNGEYRSAWALAPVTDFLNTSPAVGYQNGDPLCVEFLFRDKVHTALSQTLAYNEDGNHGMATKASPITLKAVQDNVVMTYPYVAPEV